jgi:cell pole-organizing protein PopZ
MPAAILVPILASVAGAGASFGLEKAFTPSGPSFSDQQHQMEQQAAADAEKQAKADAAQKAAALKRSAPDAQAQTGGSLTDAPFASLVSSISGVPSNIQEAMRALGLGGESSQPQQPELAFSGGS